MLLHNTYLTDLGFQWLRFFFDLESFCILYRGQLIVSNQDDWEYIDISEASSLRHEETKQV